MQSLTTASNSVEERAIHTLRALAIDAIQKANSGHPGMPMGMADAAYVLWTEFLQFDPSDPKWPDRDRFVLSAGHGSMLLYGLLHLCGFDVTLDDIQSFRQWGSRTPGHPEYGHTDGVECTTGPLGQGVSMAVGMALAEARLRGEFGSNLVDHHTWVIAGDGCLMEGVSNEAASLAGHLGLGRLNMLWDDNRITIDGATDLCFSEDVCARFAALGWGVLKVDGHDKNAVREALQSARADEVRPTLIACKTVIGRCSPNLAGSNKTHGAPLGQDEVAATKVAMGLDPEAHFAVADEVYERYRSRNSARKRASTQWAARVQEHSRSHEFLSRLSPDISQVVQRVDWPHQEVGSKLATRKSSNKMIQAIAGQLPGLIGGSADLEGSNGTKIATSGHIRRDDLSARNVHYGVREHAMAAIANGMALHGGHLPFVGTFLVFHDYMRPAVRLSALMQQQVIYVYTHDSIFLGEDGPTHQPVETLQALRGVPNLLTFRPCDMAETAAAWRVALLHREGPSAMCLTRQNVDELQRDGTSAAEGVARGAYVLREAGSPLKLVLIATGSEIHVALSARELLEARGVGTRVVSMPCCELFDVQEREYRRKILPAGTAKLSIEAGVTRDWARYVGLDGESIGIDGFGASAPAPVLAEKLGFTAENIAAKGQALLG
ncbi:MAG TPA: transketolase [Myxococcales bacterium]|nr:transketolase [Myxococcales bacterium]HAN31038.1 transketolase [Myxococcales bacterium]